MKFELLYMVMLLVLWLAIIVALIYILIGYRKILKQQKHYDDFFQRKDDD